MKRYKKTCTVCGKTKPVSDFPCAPSGKYGVRGECKDCYRIKQEKYKKPPRRWLPKTGDKFRAFVEGIKPQREHIGSPFVCVSNERYYVIAIDKHDFEVHLSHGLFRFSRISE